MYKITLGVRLKLKIVKMYADTQKENLILSSDIYRSTLIYMNCDDSTYLDKLNHLISFETTLFISPKKNLQFAFQTKM